MQNLALGPRPELRFVAMRTADELISAVTHWHGSNNLVLPRLVVGFFLDDPARIQRLEDAEIHHDRPALAGVARELGAVFDSQARAADRPGRPGHWHVHILAKIAGFVVTLIMIDRGWRPIEGKKGSISLVTWITRAQRFEPPLDHPLRAVWEQHNKQQRE